MRLSLLAVAALCVWSLAAHADAFAFVATSAGVSAYGEISGNPDPSVPGAFDITSGTLTINGVTGTLHTPGTTAGNELTYQSPNGIQNDPYNYDNVVYTGSAASLDNGGLLFDVGTDHANFYFDGATYDYSYDEISGGVPATFALLPTPEPSSFALLGTGLLGIAGVVRKRFA